ncbi:hypothetical protein MKW94_025132 [Papaver nudicaule]|uniref:Uncharacterized protein n=1 Tax=Papaver nudicaule TaxID=74823 RepID=A0AA41VE38_PAPNU|nr:hypothetical protein [Papaver nudicaule]
MELPLDGALQYLDQIIEIQDEIDQVIDKEYDDKLKLVEELRDIRRWDEKNGCLRHPRITQSQQCLFVERRELVELLPDFWITALFAEGVLVSYYMNEEDRKDMHENPYFDNIWLSKTFRFTREGISSESGTEIRWKKKGIKAFAENGGTQSHTDMPSFFKWFMEDSEKHRDLVAEKIVDTFWREAHVYYFIGMDRSAGKGMQMMTEKKWARKKFKGEGKTPEVDIPGTLSKLRTISDKLQAARQEANKERWAMERKYELMLVKREKEAHKEGESSRRSIYSRRNEIIKNIHHFWLIAFLNHYALHHLLSKEDLKILKFLNSVNVEDTEDEEGVMSGYTITLNFGKNPYFENDSLTKEISYTAMTDSPRMEYTDSEVNICVSNIQWIGGMGITTRNQRGFNEPDTSFFTWFSGLECVAMNAYDEVADLIRQDFWSNAGKYFVNVRNINDDEEVDLVGINKLERLRAFHLF